jgi:hypothetical protein
MDVAKLIRELMTEKTKLDEAISALEALALTERAHAKRRGRSGMDPGERAQVSERMKRYWARRRSEEPRP